MSRNLNINLIHRYLAGECSSREKEFVRDWLEEDPMNREAMKALEKIWEVQPQKEVESDIQMAWERLEDRLETETSSDKKKIFDRQKPYVLGKKYHDKGFGPFSSTKLNTGYRIAAILVLGVFLSLFFIEFESKISTGEQVTEVAMREVATQRGDRSQVTFNDGSKVFLNAESHIRFPDRFDNDVREVYLEGEAYFEIEHNSNKAFVVRTSEVRVRVLGTKFNVKARNDEQKVEVAVTQGKVSVQSDIEELPVDDQEVILIENQMSIVQSGFTPSEPQPVKTANILGWLAGDFIFEEVPFSEVLKEWERRFDVDFAVEDSSLMSTRFSGEFRRESLDEMLRLASQSLKFKYVRDGKFITIGTDKE